MEITKTDVPEERIAALEIRVRNLNALVNGLIEEMLDFKAVANTLTRQAGERSRQELKQAPVVQDAASAALAAASAPAAAAPSSENRTVIRPKAESQPQAMAEPAMVRIMQADGTMKMETRTGDRTIDSSKSHGTTITGTTARRK